MDGHIPARLVMSRRNIPNQPVVRLGGIITSLTPFRHTLHSATVPAIAYCRIEREGLRVSRDLSRAQWGEGAYVWSIDANMDRQCYVDVRVFPGTLVEELRINGQKPFYRLLPLSGDYVKVEIIGTNIPTATIDMFRPLAQ